MNCPGNNWGTGNFRANPMPSTQMINVIRLALRAWLMTGALPPPSRYPTLAGGTLVDPTARRWASRRASRAFPNRSSSPRTSSSRCSTTTGARNSIAADATGVPTNLPPPINQVIAMKVPRVDADGNELGGVPTVLRDAPLGTYLGWNITAAGFHQGQVCNYIGGYIPFATTLAERLGTGDPRPSLVERYGDHAGYVAAVTAAANSAFAQGYLLAGGPRRSDRSRTRRAVFSTPHLKEEAHEDHRLNRIRHRRRVLLPRARRFHRCLCTGQLDHSHHRDPHRLGNEPWVRDVRIVIAVARRRQHDCRPPAT